MLLLHQESPAIHQHSWEIPNLIIMYLKYDKKIYLCSYLTLGFYHSATVSLLFHNTQEACQRDILNNKIFKPRLVSCGFELESIFLN